LFSRRNRNFKDSGPDFIKPGPDFIKSGPDFIKSGKITLPDFIKSGPDFIKSGPESLKKGGERKKGGNFGTLLIGFYKIRDTRFYKIGHRFYKMGILHILRNRSIH
jgi:hypothetical protein